VNPKAILKRAAKLIDDRGASYGGIEQSFDRAAAIASLKLDKVVTAYDVATILESVKDARIATNIRHVDSHLDGINYRAFRLCLARPQTKGKRR
jgi:hypothetical protein